MPSTTETAQTEVHDPQILAQTRTLLDACRQIGNVAGRRRAIRNFPNRGIKLLFVAKFASFCDTWGQPSDPGSWCDGRQQ